MSKVTIVIDSDRSTIQIGSSEPKLLAADLTFEVTNDIERDLDAEERSRSHFVRWKYSGKSHISLRGTWYND